MIMCNNGCGTELTFDKSRKNADGTKMIPIEKSTNEPHNCPNSTYAKKQRGEETEPQQQVQQTITGDQPPQLSLAERIGMLELAVASMQARLSKLDPIV